VKKDALAWFTSLPRLTRILWLVAVFNAVLLATKLFG